METAGEGIYTLTDILPSPEEVLDPMWPCFLSATFQLWWPFSSDHEDPTAESNPRLERGNMKEKQFFTLW